MPNENVAFFDFDDGPKETCQLALEEREKQTLSFGAVDAAFVELSWWSIVGNQLKVDTSDSTVFDELDKVPSWNLVIESKFGVENQMPQECQVTQLKLILELELQESREATSASNDPVLVAAAWPKPNSTAGVAIRRNVSKQTELNLAKDGIGAKIGGGTEFEEKFERFVPDGYRFIGEKRVPRKLCYAIRTTETFPSIDGIHYCGTLVGHDRLRYLRVVATVEAEVRLLLNPLRRLFSKPYKLQRKQFKSELFRLTDGT